MPSDVELDGENIKLNGSATEATGNMTVQGLMKSNGGINVNASPLLIQDAELNNVLKVDPVAGVVQIKGRGTIDMSSVGNIWGTSLTIWNIVGSHKDNHIYIQNTSRAGQPFTMLTLRNDIGRSAAFLADNIQLARNNPDPSAPHRALSHSENDMLVINPNDDYKNGIAIEGASGVKFEDAQLKYVNDFWTPKGHVKGLLISPPPASKNVRLLLANTGRIILTGVPSQSSSTGALTTVYIDLLDKISDLEDRIKKLESE